MILVLVNELSATIYFLGEDKAKMTSKINRNFTYHLNHEVNIVNIENTFAHSVV